MFVKVLLSQVKEILCEHHDRVVGKDHRVTLRDVFYRFPIKDIKDMMQKERLKFIDMQIKA